MISYDIIPRMMHGVVHCVNGEPYRGKRDEPKQEEAHEISCGCP